MKKILILLLLTTSILSSQKWIQENNKISILFKIKNFGLTVDGGFKNSDIKINLDTKDISNSYVNATVMVNSIFTGIKARDTHILEKDYFDVLNYKKITLISSKIDKDINGRIILFGELTVKGISKKIELPLEIIKNDSSLTVKAVMLINRKDYNIGGRSLFLSNNVKVQVEYSAIKS